MTVQYSGRSNRLRYACTRGYTDYGGAVCQGICGNALDEMVARRVLSVLEPATLELSLAAAEDIEHERQRLDEHWRQRLERATYESYRAARQYHAVEPENRLVARELEKRWEQSLADQRQAQEAYDRFLSERPAALADADREMLRRLAEDIPALWQSPLTTAAERQQIVRHLVGARGAHRAARQRSPTWRSTGPAGTSAGTSCSARWRDMSSCVITSRWRGGSGSCASRGKRRGGSRLS